MVKLIIQNKQTTRYSNNEKISLLIVFWHPILVLALGILGAASAVREIWVEMAGGLFSFFSSTFLGLMVHPL
jgi:hypothetical protein